MAQSGPTIQTSAVEETITAILDASGHGENRRRNRSGTISVAENAECYNMNHLERGKAVIFNHKNFENMEQRQGTDIDKARLVVCLENLNFHVQVHDDLTKLEILVILKNLKNEDHTKRDCLVVIVLSHGSQEAVFASDTFYRPEELWNPFTADSCISLAGKPKMFFVQACRGNTKDTGTELTLSGTQIDSRPLTPGVFSYSVPNWADFLIAFSTPPGYVSWRSKEKGSWFIDSLVTVLEEKSASLDLMTMMTLVTRKVALSYSSSHPNPEMNRMKQVPMTSSTLTRLLKF